MASVALRAALESSSSSSLPVSLSGSRCANVISGTRDMSGQKPATAAEATTAEAEPSLLMRLIDDFLFITPDIEVAREFVHLVHASPLSAPRPICDTNADPRPDIATAAAGQTAVAAAEDATKHTPSRPFQIRVNREKTLVNFECQDEHGTQASFPHDANIGAAAV